MDKQEIGSCTSSRNSTREILTMNVVLYNVAYNNGHPPHEFGYSQGEWESTREHNDDLYGTRFIGDNIQLLFLS